MTSAQADQPKLNSSGTVTGPGVLTSGDWGLAKTSVDNPTNQDQSLLATITFNKDAALSNVQFARQFWIPANSTRELLIPIKAPDFSSNTKSVDAQVQLLDTHGNSDVFLSRDTALYRAANTSQVSVKTFSPHSASGYDLTGTLREQMGNSYTYLNLPAAGIPQSANLMSNVNVLLLGDDQLHLDPMQILALRQWILAGGQLIVLLPETGMPFCRTLLGDHLQMQLVDQTSLDSASIEGSNVFTDGGMTSKISNKVNQPRGWELGKFKENRVDIHGGGTRLRNPGSSDTTIIHNSVELSPQWDKIKIEGRVRVEKNNQASGAVMRASFFNALKQLVGRPVDLVSNINSRWQTWEKQITLPSGATSMKLEVGMQDVQGTLWASSMQVTPMSMRFETPTAFWRVLAPGMETESKLMINGWPMMLRSDMGRGRVTILTVGSDYWTAVSKAGSHLVDEAFRTVNSSASRAPINTEQLTTASTQQIGYEVLSRTPVMIILIAMIVIMMLAGMVFWKMGNAELLAPVSVILALVVGGVIWGLGISHHRLTPLTIASVQLAQIDPLSNNAITDGVVCTYSPTRLKSPLAATDGGVIWPDLSGSTGKLLRMRWTDCDKWQWDNLELSEGTLRSHEIHRVIPLDQPVKAVASFTREGVTCTIASGPYAGVDHPIIASINNHAVGLLTGHDTFTITPDYTLGLDQFVTSSTMSALDIQRQDIYRGLIYPNSEALDVRAYPQVPSAMWWSRAMDMGFTQGSEDARKKQSALVCVPLTFERPAPGSTICIPSPILQTSIWRDGDHAMSTVINPMTGRWTSTLSQEAKFTLAFTVPSELLPIKAQDGILDIDFKTPGRSLIVTTTRGEEIVRKRDLANRIQIPVSGEQLLVNKQGQITLTFEVTAHDDPAGSHMWDASGGIRLQIMAVTQ
jgi:hypothetical protein